MGFINNVQNLIKASCRNVAQKFLAIKTNDFFDSASSVNDDLWCFLAIPSRVSFKSFKSSELNNEICI